jgi:3,4-dihydroxy 2-butanone 4-phosphate synthase/GTP cyclohydrolase II
MAKDGGVLVRAGHTEAAVDVSRLAGLMPSGVICEIMNDDGSMARLPDLVQFAQLHGLKIGTIADLIAYRRRTERLVKREIETQFKSRVGGDWTLYVYTDTVTSQEHLALAKGDIAAGGPVMVRMHQVNIFADMFMSEDSPRTGWLHKTMEMIDAYGCGVVVALRDTMFGKQIAGTIAAKLRGEEITRLIDYGVGAQILADLGVHNMILITNTSKHIIGLEGYGLKVVEQRSIPG